jgi:hypothetical protein
MSPCCQGLTSLALFENSQYVEADKVISNSQGINVLFDVVTHPRSLNDTVLCTHHTERVILWQRQRCSQCDLLAIMWDIQENTFPP